MGRRGFANRAIFDPNAFDADNDGRVQDSTPFERPAMRKPSMIQPMLAPRDAGQGDRPPKSNASKVLSGINKNASKEKFDAGREYGDYETKFPKHEVDGTMRRDTADLPKMREMMKELIKEAKTSAVNYSTFSEMSDSDLQEFWSLLNSMPEPETRAQFLAMMLADFEIGLRKLARDRAKTGPAPFEDKDKVKKIIENLSGRGLI